MRLLILLLFVLFVLVGAAAAEPADFGARLSAAAIERTSHEVAYDPSYVVMPYPGGDAPAGKGVCSDEVIRAMRAVGVDLQLLVHEDMKQNFSAYPALWGLARPDTNIDHRRVPNLEAFFTRAGARLPLTPDVSAYKPGDIVAWNLRGDAGFLPHIGIVTDRVGRSGWPMVVHNIGAGPELEDVLFQWPMTGHYRYRPQPSSS